MGQVPPHWRIAILQVATLSSAFPRHGALFPAVTGKVAGGIAADPV